MNNYHLDNLKCPQYVDFLNGTGNTSSTESMLNLSNQMSDEDSIYEGVLSVDNMSSLTPSSNENFVVHVRTAENQQCRIKKKATVPKPFSFKTDARLKDKNALVNAESVEKDFASQLRHHKEFTSTKVNGVTKVKPFNLTEATKRKAGSDYLPLAEEINKFQKTPERYRSSANKVFQPREHWSPPKLRPRTPKLLAVKRHRAVKVMSREEKEAKELEEIKAYEFHAQPVDPRVYKPVNIEKTEKKETTKTKNVQLKTAERAKTWQSTEDLEKTYQFRARPVPKAILEGPTGLGEKPEIAITKPKAPSFTTEIRSIKRKLLEQQHENSESPLKKAKIVKNKPVKKLTPVKLQKTVVKPFSFDKKDKERFALKEKKIQEEIEKENKPFVFKAQLMPSPQVSALPQVQKKSPTEVQPFNFVLDARSFTHSLRDSFQEKTTSFKANPATVLHKEPFIPEKPAKQHIDIKEFELQTDRRASERLRLKEQKEAEEREKEQILLARKAIEEEREHQEIIQLRQNLVHKANPIRHFKTVEVKPSAKPLTQPISPKFETDKRLQSRE